MGKAIITDISDITNHYCKGFVCAFLREDVADRCQATNMKCERERCDCYGSCCVCMRNEDNEDLKESLV